MNVVAAVVAGLIGTTVMSLMMALSPRMGMPKMAIWEMLGSMFNPQGNNALGWVMHYMMGVIFALVYAALWSAGIGAASIGWGALFGVVHWLAAGLMMGGMPMMHAGIRSGAVDAPGVYMLASGGAKAFMGGTVGHVLYGIVVALVYAGLAG